MNRAWRRARLNTELLEQDWCRDLFGAFCGWLTERCQAGDITRRVDNYARFFQSLDQRIYRPDQLVQSRLTELFSPEELRRHFMVVRFLIERQGVEWQKSKARQAAHARRNQARLAACQSEPWSDLVEGYCEYLRAKPAASGVSLGEGTIGTYLNAAISLLKFEEITRPEQLKPDAVRRFAKSHAGYSASLAAFITYLRTVKGVDAEQLPKSAPKRRAFERNLVREVQVLLKRLDATDNHREARALIARSISRIYQLPLIEVLDLRWGQVRRSGTRVGLCFDSGSIELAPELAAPTLKWLNPGHPMDPVFPGRIPELPMSSSTVRYHLGLAGAVVDSRQIGSH